VSLSFRLPDAAVEPYENRPVPWGFGILSEITFLRTYSRKKPDGSKETWTEVCRRVIEGMYSIQKDHCIANRLPWIEDKAVASAAEAFDRLWNMKWTPPGRGLWVMGTEFVHERKNSAALQNCAFVSSENFIRSMAFLMEASMLGIGVGSNTDAAEFEPMRVSSRRDHDGKSFPRTEHLRWTGSARGGEDFAVWGGLDWEDLVRGHDAGAYVIADTREGWVESTVHILESFLGEATDVPFVYDAIRPEGTPIEGFGGTAAGPGPLIELHSKMREILRARDGELLTITDVADIANLIGKCVVAGNVRRSAEILLGSPTEEFMALKDPAVNPDRNDWATGWGHLSNNSVYAKVGDTDYAAITERVANNGEPGLFYLDLARQYGRMEDEPNGADYRAVGTNPCGEQTLESFECCTLVETYPTRCDDLDDYLRTLKFAYMYAKAVTLLPTHWEETNAIMQRNRRIGTSMTGLAQFVEQHTVTELWRWQDAGYQEIQRWDHIYSEWLCVRESIKTTSVKPSGTVSLLAGVTPGAHWPTYSTYIRRMRIAASDPLVGLCIDAGYHVEPEANDPKGTMVIEFPVRLEGNVRTEEQVSVWEKVALVAGTQRWWADNQVSATATFRKDEVNDLAAVLRANEGSLKSISLLPIFDADTSAYTQVPYENISDEEYERAASRIRPVDTAVLYGHGEEALGERYCSNDRCEVPA
jgi:ribonucleoside-triphosphate reductase (thioredoxin)